MEPTDQHREIARTCKTMADGVMRLRREGLSEGRAISLIAKCNPKIYNLWRAQPHSQQPKPSDIARQPQKFAFRG